MNDRPRPNANTNPRQARSTQAADDAHKSGSIEALVETHEAIARLFDALARAPVNERSQRWGHFRTELQRLLGEQRLALDTLRQDEGSEYRTLSDSQLSQHQRAVARLLEVAEQRLPDADAWQDALENLAEHLTWTFVRLEEQGGHS